MLDISSFTVLLDIGGPEPMAGRAIETIQDTRCSHRVDLSVHDGGRGAGSGAADATGEVHGVGVNPDRGSVGNAIASHAFLRLALFLRNGVAPHDGEGAPAGADGLAPEFPGRLPPPVAGQTRLGKYGQTAGSEDQG